MTSQQDVVPAKVFEVTRGAGTRGATPARPGAGALRQATSIVRCSLWTGLIAGLAELMLTLAQKPLSDPSPGLFRLNRHILWTVPTVNLTVFLLCGIVLALVLQVLPRLGARSVIAPLAFLASFTVLLSCRWLHVIGCLVVALLATMRLTRRIEKSIDVFERLVRQTFPAIALVVACPLVVSIGQSRVFHSAVPGAATRLATVQAPPNVLLIVLDTVRADHLTPYEYSRNTTPNLARLAPLAVKFDRARSTAPWTLPSHASMMTGRWPHELSTSINHPLDETHRTVAEALVAQGYATGGFIGNVTYCGVETGLGRGFAHFEDHVLSVADAVWTTALGQRVILQMVFRPERRAGGHPNEYHRKDAASIRQDLLTWLKHQGQRPFFAFVNFYDAHDPYIAPTEFQRRFAVGNGSMSDPAILERWFISDKTKLSSAQVSSVLDSYDDCIAYLDEQLGLLFDELERVGRLANTVVIVTADHGEELGEHGLYGHASSLYNQEIHVPLLIFLPGGAHAGKCVRSQVSLRDVAATIADVTGLDRSSFPGRSLARHWHDETDTHEEPSLSEVDAPVMSAPNQGRSPVFRGPMKAIASRDHVYIKNGDGKEELFNVNLDPAQSADLSKLPGFEPLLDEFRTTLERDLRDQENLPPRSAEN
jgi:arylsulfatase A-like enzyme